MAVIISSRPTAGHHFQRSFYFLPNSRPDQILVEEGNGLSATAPTSLSAVQRVILRDRVIHCAADVIMTLRVMVGDGPLGGMSSDPR